jgi:outer membrane protein TolC
MITKNWRTIVLTLFTVAFFPHLVFAEEPLTLEASIDMALKNSIIINIAKEGSKSANAQKREAFTGFLPKFSTSYNYTRLNEEPSLKLPGGFPPLIMTPIEMVTGTQNNYNWVIEAKQPLFAGGGILANYQANSIGEDAAHLEETAKYQDVVQEVKIAYFNILRAQRIRDAAQQSVEMLSAHRDVAENYFKVGMIPKNDLLHAEVELANGKQALVRAKNAVELAKSSFNTVLKRKIFAPVEVVDILAYHPLNQSFEECLNVARQARPELKISSLKAAQAGKIVRVAQSDYFPTLSVVGNYTRFGDNPSVAGSDYQNMESWYVMGVVSWNFWEWGKTKFRVDASKAKENQALEAAKELNDQITLEIKNAYLILQETESQIIVWQKVIEQAEENFRISEERYKERVSTSTEVLDAQTLLTKAKSEYANALGDYNVNYAKLQRAMGTIWGIEGEAIIESENNLKTDKRDIKITGEGNPKAQEENSTTKEENPIKIDKALTNSEHTSSPDKQLTIPPVTEKPASISETQITNNSSPEEDVKNLIDKWLNAWQSGDMKTYANCYAADFYYKGRGLNAWVSYKIKLHRKNEEISIRIEDLKILSDAKASNVKAVFTQYYNSSMLKDKVRKTLVLKNVNGEWKIFKETSDSRK